MELDSFLNSHDPENTSLFRYMHPWSQEQDQSDPLFAFQPNVPDKAVPEPPASPKPSYEDGQESKKVHRRHRESTISHTNAQKSYSIFEDAEILKRLNAGKNGKGPSRFTNLKSLVPQFSRSLMGIQNRSRLLAKLVNEDKAYLIDYAQTRPEEAKTNFFVWKRSRTEGNDQQIEVTGVQTFTNNSTTMKVAHKQRGSKDKRVVACEEIKTLLKTGAINEDDYFSDSSELSWIKAKGRKGCERSQTEAIKGGQVRRLSGDQRKGSDRQTALDEELIFLKDLIFYLINSNKMKIETILEVARQKYQNVPEIEEFVRQVIRERFVCIQKHGQE